MNIIRSQQFWIGVVVALVLMYLYQNHFKGMGGKGGNS